jgi:hypothetical protein
MAAPAVAGSVALMLEANPALTPNLVKAILQYTAQVHPDYDGLTQGAGFLNTMGAIEMARAFANHEPGAPYPNNPHWSRHIIWGNHRLTGGVLLPSANAWDDNIVWGSALDGNGDNIVWGSSDYDNIVWGSSGDDNIVWGSSDYDNIVWGSSDYDNIVWGSNGGDNIVWGSNAQQQVPVWPDEADFSMADPAVWPSLFIAPNSEPVADAQPASDAQSTSEPPPPTEDAPLSSDESAPDDVVPPSDSSMDTTEAPADSQPTDSGIPTGSELGGLL